MDVEKFYDSRSVSVYRVYYICIHVALAVFPHLSPLFTLIHFPRRSSAKPLNSRCAAYASTKSTLALIIALQQHFSLYTSRFRSPHLYKNIEFVAGLIRHERGTPPRLSERVGTVKYNLIRARPKILPLTSDIRRRVASKSKQHTLFNHFAIHASWATNIFNKYCTILPFQHIIRKSLTGVLSLIHI